MNATDIKYRVRSKVSAVIKLPSRKITVWLQLWFVLWSRQSKTDVINSLIQLLSCQKCTRSNEGNSPKDSGEKHDTPLSKDVTTTSLLFDSYHKFMMTVTTVIGD